MHEGGLVRALIRMALERAEGAPLRRVGVRIGALAGVSAAHLRDHWDEEVRGTPAASAELVVEASDDPTDPRALDVVLEWIERGA